MKTRRERLEAEVQRQIEAAIGAEHDLLLMRNSVGQARFIKEEDGSEYFVPYGLMKGSPDLVGILRVQLRRREPGSEVLERPSDGEVFAITTPTTVGVWFCLEVKPLGVVATPEQEKVHAMWRRFGAFVAVVHSPEEARSALERARRGQLS